MNDQERQCLFAELIGRYQSELYGYIYAVVRNWQDTDDLYQSVCLVLWSKFTLFRPGTSFFAWARQTAKIEISSFLRTKRLPSCRTEELVDALWGDATDSQDDEDGAYMAALQHCRERLTPPDAELIQLRYVENLSTVEIADRLQRLRPSISRSLNRIRRVLFECVETELTKREFSPKELS